jgi:hypothetical protein
MVDLVLTVPTGFAGALILIHNAFANLTGLASWPSWPLRKRARHWTATIIPDLSMFSQRRRRSDGVVCDATTLPLALDSSEQKVNTPAWMTGTASPTIHSSWCGSPVASAHGADRIGWHGWRRNSVRRSVCATSRIGFPTTACGGRRRAAKRGRSSCGVYLPDLEQPGPPDDPPGRAKLRLIKNT